MSVSGVLSLGILLGATLTAGAPALAAGESTGQQGIAAVINDQIVSRYDLEQRVKLIMVTSGIPDSPENISRIEPQVLRTLVDETLETQEADRLDIKVEEKEINEQIEGIAKRANMTTEQIDDFLKENKVSRNSLLNQIRAEIAWNKVIGQRFSPTITVSEEEVTEVLNRLNEEANEPRYLVSEILLTFDTPSQEQEMMGGASRLAEQIRMGAPFAAVAQQFSRAATAANGGDMGWVHLSQLPEGVSEMVSQMGIGAVSEPVKTLNGIYIVQLRNKQSGTGSDPMQDEWTFRRVVLPLTPDAPPAALERRAVESAKFIREFKSCDAIDEQIKSYLGGRADAARSAIFGSLDGRMQSAVSKSKPGQTLPPLRSQEGIEIVAVCDHKANAGEMPTRDSIEDNLFSQQLSMMARRHLRDLRRDAVIEMR
ncbi:MAG: peptidylprolyl isomerase [Parvibaculum sp.]|nr:peptidylprolyl isomerase [Parvibaculum sp.]